MKVFAFALILLVALTYGEALQCHNCVHSSPDANDCVETVEVCPADMDVCAKVTNPPPNQNVFHKFCYKMVECQKLEVPQGVRVSCCNWDNCNAY